MGKRLWDVLRVVYYMIRKGITKQNLLMELRVLLKCGKIAGKAIANVVTFNHHHHHSAAATGSSYSDFSCRSMDPNLAFYTPREVEFSCSNTPAFPSLHPTRRRHRHHHYRDYQKYDAATVAKVFEILNSNVSDDHPAIASPSPAVAWSYGKSPAGARQLRITDSPFPIMEEEGEVDGHVDSEAEEFIRRFYEQLRLQQQQQQRRAPAPVLGRARG